MITTLLFNFGIGIAIAATLIYVWLRHLSTASGGHHPARVIKRHAWWTAFIALFASATAGLPGLWEMDTTGFDGLAGSLAKALGPGVWLGVIYLLGQFTWPRQVGTRRSATLKVRRVRDYLPRTLAAVFAGSWLLAAGLAVWAWGVPGVAALPVPGDGSGGDAGNGSWSGLELPGVLAGATVAPLLLAGLVLVAAVVIGLLFLVASRPALSVLGAGEDANLRTLWMNRLLRTGVMISTGFLSATGEYLAFALKQRTQAAALAAGTDPYEALSTIYGTTNAISGITGFWLLVTGLVMLVWPVPPLADDPGTAPVPEPRSPGFDAALRVLSAVQYLAVIALLVTGALASIVPVGSGTGEMWVTTVSPDGQEIESLVTGAQAPDSPAFVFPAVLLAAGAVLYYLLQGSVALWIRFKLCERGTFNPVVPGILPRWFLAVNGALLVVALGATALFAADSLGPAPQGFEATSGPGAGTTSAWWLGAALLVVACLGLGLFRIEQTSGPLLLGSAREDAELRILIGHRAVRLVGGLSLVCLGILAISWDKAGPAISTLFGVPARYADYMPEGAESTGFTATGIIIVILGVLWCLLPAATVGHRHAEALAARSHPADTGPVAPGGTA